ncbi:MAG TPA: hydantoinase B/oxoprolinase family protein [Acidimicrobiales bacterium]|jgi:N-methylhydantoinase B|nr:hydantoinase B/oxoprolinase family protein [Acidimicrobiales bacterium]
MTTTANATDALGAEILRHALRVAAEEASIVVVRSAHSTMIVEGADACSALLDASGRLVSLSTATNLMHASSLRSSLPALIEDHPLDTMRAGDVFVMNDVFRGGIHANDLLVFRPVFAPPAPGADPVVHWFAGTLIHVVDLGGVSAGGIAATATDVFAEGLQLPPVRLYAAGAPVPDMQRLLALNSRLPHRVMGDVEALVAGVNVLAARTDALIERYGVATLQAGIDAYLDSTERRTRADLARLPAGVYHGEYVIDNDGIDLERALIVRVTVTVGDGTTADGTITLDFAGTDDQVLGAVNAGFSQALTGVHYAVRCFVDPTIPMNEGCFAPVTVRLPYGSLVNPKPPSACGGRVVSVCAAVEAILEALARAVPERAVAASTVIHPYTVSGRGPDGTPFVLLSYEFGGIGGRHGVDGPDATGAFFLGGRNTVPQVEAIEATMPLRFERQGYAIDSGGPGRWRGGAGVETRIRVLGDGEIAVRSERVRIAPRGRNGGRDGVGGSQYLERGDVVAPVPAKAVGVPVRAGEVFVLTTSGGGGLGDPFTREPDAVAADVAARKVSRDAAARDYGVVLTASGDVDVEATARVRRGGEQ